MTKFFIAAAALAFSSSTGSGQAINASHTPAVAPRPKPTDLTAVTLTREMTERLHLNEGQFIKLLPLTRTRLARLQNIQRMYRNDEETRSIKKAEVEAQFERDCSLILTPSQLSQLQEKGQPAVAPAAGNGLG